MDAIYAKTSAGYQELAERSRKLPARLRSLLVMTDGRKPSQTLIATLAPLGVNAESLRELLLAGLIEFSAWDSPPSTGEDATTQETTGKPSADEPVPSFLPKWPPD
jgi:hypothetical protein